MDALTKVWRREGEAVPSDAVGVGPQQQQQQPTTGWDAK